MKTRLTTAELAVRLQAGARDAERHVAAAVDLVIGQHVWLGRQEFVDAAVREDAARVWIDFDAARRAFDQGQFRGTVAELAVLNFAIAVARDEFQFTELGNLNTQLVVRAAKRALGLRA